MVEEIFRGVLEVSIGTSLVIGGLLISLPILRKRYHVKWCYFVWLIICVRLMIPTSIRWENQVQVLQWIGAMEKRNVIQEVEQESYDTIAKDELAGNNEIGYKLKEKQNQAYEKAEILQGNEMINTEASNHTKVVDQQLRKEENQLNHFSLVSNEQQSINAVSKVQLIGQQNILQGLGYLWLIGILIISSYHLIGYRQFIRNCKRWGSKKLSEEEVQIFQSVMKDLEIKTTISLIKSKKVETPLIVGFLKPIVVLPYKTYDKESLYFILKHELIHYKRKDLWYKLILLITRCLHWFNPLVHIMAKHIEQDLEASCDEHVMRYESNQNKKRYMQIILAVAEGKGRYYESFTTQFNSEKVTLLYRFQTIMGGQVKKRGILAIALVLVISIGCSGCFSVSQQDKQDINSKRQVVSINGYSIEIPKEWEVKNLEKEEDVYAKAERNYVVFYNKGEIVGGLGVAEGKMQNQSFVIPSVLTKLSEKEREAFTESLYTRENIEEIMDIIQQDGGIFWVDYKKNEKVVYTECTWDSLNANDEYYVVHLTLNRRFMQKEESNKIIDSFKAPYYIDNQPTQTKKPLSLEKAA